MSQQVRAAVHDAMSNSNGLELRVVCEPAGGVGQRIVLGCEAHAFRAQRFSLSIFQFELSSVAAGAVSQAVEHRLVFSGALDIEAELQRGRAAVDNEYRFIWHGGVGSALLIFFPFPAPCTVCRAARGLISATFT